MKRRITKKLSKRIAEILPQRYKHAFVDKFSDKDDPTYGIICVGGEWMPGCDDFNDITPVLSDFNHWLPWEICPQHPEGHNFEHWPNPTGFKFKGVHLIKYARLIAAKKQGVQP